MKDAFLFCCKRKLGDGTRTRFWEDLWLGNVPFAVKYARLFDLVYNKHVTVANVFDK